MDLFDIFLPLAVVFTVLSILLIVVILGLHGWEDLRICRETDFRKTAAPVVKNCLVGSARLEEAVAVLKKNPPAALQLLLEQSEALGPGETERLRALFRSFPFKRQMLAGLKNRSRDTRLQNAQLLGYLRDESAIPDLLEALNDEAPDVRLAAAQSLATLGHSDAECLPSEKILS